MAGKTARKYFLGQGVSRLGCAQAVAEALRQQWLLDDALVMSMAEATGGRAPGGNAVRFMPHYVLPVRKRLIFVRSLKVFS